MALKPTSPLGWRKRKRRLSLLSNQNRIFNMEGVGGCFFTYLGVCALQWQMYWVMVSSSNRSSNFLLKSGRNLFTKPGPGCRTRCEKEVATLRVPQRSSRTMFALLTQRSRCSNHSKWVEEGNDCQDSLHPAGRGRPLHHICPLALLVLDLGSLRKTPGIYQDKV